MEELVRCDSCQEDAAALFKWSREAGLVDNETKSIFEDNLCVVFFITCVRLSEALADGGPGEGYIIWLSNHMDTDVYLVLQQRGWKPLVFSGSFYRLRHVVCLSAYQLPMQGSLSDEIAKVTSLRAIFLAYMNGMEGILPARIGELPYLKGLYLWGMNTIGPFPSSITKLSRLEALDIAGTNISGPIPQDIGRLRRLRVLRMWANERMEGRFSASVTSCRNLSEMSLLATGLTGPLPGDLGALSRLVELDLTGNSLTGKLPELLVQLSRLQKLVLVNNTFSGPLPNGLGTNMDSLKSLGLTHNDYSGPLPSSLGNARNLTGLWIEKTGLSGVIPSKLGQLAKLREVYLSNNQLFGDLPNTLNGWKSVEHLSLHNNNLSGTLEPLSALTSLRTLWIGNNSFEGYVPIGFRDFENLTEISAANNRLAGWADWTGGNLSVREYHSLRQLYMSSNRINGTLKPLSHLISLRTLLINNNLLSGSIPAELGQLTELRKVYLHDNQLSGTLPDTLSGWKSVEYLAIDHNNFSGTLEPLSTLTSLRQLWVSDNWFEGYLPAGKFENLSEIHAANNRLVGLVEEHSLHGASYESLQLLRLPSNRLNGSVNLSVFPKLEEAYLGSNLITGLTGNLPQLLQSLNLRNNLLTTLPQGFRSMPNLKRLYLANNRISQWPKWGSTPEGVCHTQEGLNWGEWNMSSLLSAVDPPDWNSLYELDVSNNPIMTDVTDFLMPLKWQDNLMALDASNCSLHGAMRCEAFLVFPRRMLNQSAYIEDLFLVKTAFYQLGSISLKDNNITAIETFQAFYASDSSLYHVDFRNNSLIRVGRLDSVLFSSDYARFTQNPDLKRTQTGVCVSDTPIEKCQDFRRSSSTHHAFSRCPALTAYDKPQVTPLLPDPQGYVVQRLDNGEERFECTEFCSVFNRLEVDYTFDSDALCRCLPGYEGIGINCTKCPPGTYSNRQNGTQRCKQCPDDAGSDEGLGACYCHLGHQRGEEPCEPCIAGSVGVRKIGSGGSRSTWICQDCLPGLNCSVPINYNASVLPGFFQLTVQLQSDDSSHNATREVTTYAAGLTLLPIAMQCPLASACKGTNKTDGLNTCLEGHEGFVCSRWKAGFSRHTPQQPCARCVSLWQIILFNVLFVVATLIAIFILTALAERASSSPRAEIPSQLIKIGLSHITAVCGLAFLVFDESLWGNQISSLVGSFFAWNCGVPQSYQVWECLLRPYVGDKCVLYRHAMWLALPLVWLTAAPLIASGFDKARDAFKSRRRIGSDESTSFATIDSYFRALSAPASVITGKADKAAAHGPHHRLVTFQEDIRTEPVTPPSCQHSSAEPCKSGRWRQWLDSRGGMMVVILTFIHPTVTKSMLALLRCRPYPYVDAIIPIASGESVSLLSPNPMDDTRPGMDLDSRVICRSGEHAPFLWIAVAGLLLWTFAPVVCGVAFLWRYRDSLDDHHTRRRVGFLYVGYRKSFYYWDFVLAMRRVLVLLIAQQATAQPRQQLLGWTVVASVCLALQFAIWPFDRGSMDILNQSELRGLLVWLRSLFSMHFVVMLPEGTSLVLTIGFVLVVIAANLVHYIMLVAQICREEDKRRVSPKVFYDWSTAALSADGPPTASWRCLPSFGRPVHRVVTAMQLTSAAVQDAIEALKLTHVPSDFHEFLWSHAFLVQSLRQKRVETRSRWRGHVVVHLPRPDDRTVTGLRHMKTSDLSNVFRIQRSSDVSTQLEAGKTSNDEPSGQPELSDVSSGITLHDLQANLCYVVDELGSREQMHQAALRRTADSSDLENADTEVPTDQQPHTGGWRGLYEAFRKAKRTLIEEGSPPDAIPEVLASFAPTVATVVEPPCGDAEDVPMSGESSPVSSTQSRHSDAHTSALTPPCNLMRVDWHRLSSDEKDSVALSVSAEAVYDACSGLSASCSANSDD
ncbi:unnamed protein product [Vitrella brassicaformis CCMP3155]|uniref:EGF-like domain-containing protein n=1 Tax=Vitrella brassicaformis (strain CCMP3155) TaxID=1169540 RepID=A0A0G4FF75_VITBC|nr:unnamed protein product [Vitrella brassicaformis CCMP3155]|eukprot:CEM11834.1 unnamed protein product [Vitrella brassicaformis CCMP3155]